MRKSTKVLYTLAEAYGKQGQHHKALKAYRQLYDLLVTGKDPDAKYNHHELDHELIPQVKEAIDYQLNALRPQRDSSATEIPK